MRIKNYVSISVILFLVSSITSQNRRLAKAAVNFDNYAYIDAQHVYLKVAKRGYKSADLYKKLGDSYYFNAKLKDALFWYNKLFTEYRDQMGSEYLFRHAQSLKSTEDYKGADATMEAFDSAVNGGQNRAQLFDKERNYLEFIEMQSGRFVLADAGVNTQFSDFAPSFRKEEIVFASARNRPYKKVIHEWNEKPFLDLYTSIPDNNELAGVSKLNGKTNTKFHESSTSFSKDGKTMYFTRNNYTNKKLGANGKGTTLLKLYRSKYVNGRWDEAVELPFNSDSYSVAHPALSPDGKNLYFASDMPGGKGLSDLYVVAINEDGSYGNPKNLGDVINTEGRETFPYISDIGRLYLASDGHIGLGGLDVFVAIPNGINSFEKPINVGKPVNSPSDDFTFVLKEKTKIGYFASNRPGGVGDDDIYSFVQTDELITSCKQSVVGVLTDTETKARIPNATVLLLDEDMNIINEVITDDVGTYRFKLSCDKNFIIHGEKKPEYSTTEVALSTNYQFEFEHEMPLQLEKNSDYLKTVAANLGDDLAKSLQLQPIYFDFDKSKIRPDAAVELQKVIVALQEYPKLKIDVRSHTDSRADDTYNLQLSERRAVSTIAYILKAGISKDRVDGRGYGETSLVNDCVNKAKCSEEQHQLNRRSEFIIVE